MFSASQPTNSKAKVSSCKSTLKICIETPLTVENAAIAHRRQYSQKKH